MNNPIEDIYPLSPMQKGMLFQSLLNPDVHPYHEQLLCTVTGEIDVKLFQESWHHVIQDNPVLRTVFDWEGDEPVQIVLRTPQFVFEYEDIPEINKIQIGQDSQKDLERGFNLEKGPLIRFKLFCLNKQKSILRISYHHILIDGSSLPILFADFHRYYDSLKQKITLPHLIRSPYREYIRWLISQKEDNARVFWSHYLADYKNNLESKTQTLLDPTGSSVSRIKVFVSKKDTDELLRISRNSHVTVNNILQMVWALTLYKMLNTSDLMFGSTVSGRPADLLSSKKMVGLFINTLPLRVRINKHESFMDVARKIQLDWAEMQDYSFLPLSEIKKQMKSRPLGDPFDSIFVFADNSVLGHSKDFPLRFDIYEYRELTNYTYTLDVTLDQRITIQLSYPSGVIPDKSARVIVHNYIGLIKKIIHSPHESISFYLDGEKKQELQIHGNKETHISKIETKNESNDQLDLTEEDIKIVWADVLHLEDVSSTDNFFELGGDSISCLRIVTKLLQKNYVVTLKQVFENPTIRSLAPVIRKESRRTKGMTFIPSPQIIHRMQDLHKNNCEKILPLSYIQQSVIDDHIKGRSVMYHDQSAFEYAGEIDYQLFEEAWNKVLEANSILRSVFYWDKEESIQAILKKYRLNLDIYDLTHQKKDTQQIIIEDYKKRDLMKEFKLEKEPPVRICLFQLSQDRHIFILSFDVILLDGWCFAFVLSDFYNYYRSLMKNEQPQLIIREPYEKYVDWVREKDVNKAVTYWQEYLKDYKPLNQIRRKQKKNTTSEYEVKSLKNDISSNLIKRIESASKKEHITLNSLFQTVWAYTLHQISSQKEIIIGATVSGRPPALTGSEQIIGLFFNDVPIRFNFTNENNLFKVAQKVQKEFSSSREYEYLATSQIKKLLNLRASQEIFQTLFIFENYPKHEQLFLQSQKKEFLKEISNWRRESSIIDMNIYVEVGENSSIEIRYLKDLFHEQKIQKILSLYISILTQLGQKSLA